MGSERRQIENHALQLAASEWGGRVKGRKLLPLGEGFRGLVSEAGNVCLAEGSWHPIIAEPKQEELAVKEIAVHGLPAYRPVLSVLQRPRRGEVRVVQRSMFGAYLFVRCADRADSWDKITSARGVKRVLTAVGGRMGVVPDGAIEVIRLYEATRAEEFAELQRMRAKGIVWHFTPGEVARITNGPFAGFAAELETAVDEHDRITALIHYFGRSSRVTLSAHDLEKL